ncbi:MAG: hypothetical protein E7318_01695 [Clostridiales bacterium]|nr:hypothetical protein [Clostridiales bacterium]
MTVKKNKQKIEKVSKPYLRGDMYDRTTIPGAIKFFFGMLGMAVAFVIFCVMLNIDHIWLRVIVNLAIVMAFYLFYAQFGMNAGADAVNQGEIMYARQEKGRPVADWEKKLCYHPFKGFLSALIGSLPVVLCSLILAFIAKRQMTSLGALPAWVTSFEGREEIGGALTYYHVVDGMSLETIMRLIIRMTVMPFVNIVGAENMDAMLTLERVSPVLNLLPAVIYGIGYMRGVAVRTTVHTDIALGKKKAKRKQAKERRARVQRTPNQLN